MELPLSSMLTVSISVTVRITRQRTTISVKTEPECSLETIRELVLSVGQDLSNRLPVGRYVFHATMSGGIHAVQFPNGSSHDLIEALTQSLRTKAEELAHALVRTLREIPDEERVQLILRETYAFIFETLMGNKLLEETHHEQIVLELSTGQAVTREHERAQELQMPCRLHTLRGYNVTLALIREIDRIRVVLGLIPENSPFRHLAQKRINERIDATRLLAQSLEAERFALACETQAEQYRALAQHLRSTFINDDNPISASTDRSLSWKPGTRGEA